MHLATPAVTLITITLAMADVADCLKCPDAPTIAQKRV